MRQGYPVSPFLNNFVTKYVLQNTLPSLLDGIIEHPPGKSFSLKYVDEIALLSDRAQAMQRSLERLVIQVSR